MLIFWRTAAVLAIAAAPIFAGALRLEIRDPENNPEVKGKGAVLIAQTTACQSPEKSVITATAEGIVDGQRRTVPLKVVTLSTPGMFALAREWPEQGIWAVKIVATNPDYKNYATGVLIPVDKGAIGWAAVKHYSRAPSSADVDSVLGNDSIALARH